MNPVRKSARRSGLKIAAKAEATARPVTLAGVNARPKPTAARWAKRPLPMRRAAHHDPSVSLGHKTRSGPPPHRCWPRAAAPPSCKPAPTARTPPVRSSAAAAGAVVAVATAKTTVLRPVPKARPTPQPRAPNRLRLSRQRQRLLAPRSKPRPQSHRTAKAAADVAVAVTGPAGTRVLPPPRPTLKTWPLKHRWPPHRRLSMQRSPSCRLGRPPPT